VAPRVFAAKLLPPCWYSLLLLLLLLPPCWYSFCLPPPLYESLSLLCWYSFCLPPPYELLPYPWRSPEP
jgi:hypothetical protein